jgi:hypothetical protein
VTLCPAPAAVEWLGERNCVPVILLVEDDIQARTLLRSVLKMSGSSSLRRRARRMP